MSKERIVKEWCVHCNHEFDYTIHDSVNVTLDPQYKEKVLKCEMFDWVCPNCKKKNFSMYQFVYNDMDKKLMINFQNRINLYNDFEAMLKVEEMMTSYLPNIKSEFTNMAASEYSLVTNAILAKDYGYDHRIALLYLVTVEMELGQFFKVQHSYLDVNKETKKLQINIVTKDKDGTVKETVIPFNEEQYNEIKEKYQNKFTTVSNYVFTKEAAFRMLKTNEEEEEKLRNTTHTFAIVQELEDKFVHIAYVLPEIAHKVKENGKVLINERGWTGKTASVVKKVFKFNAYESPLDPEELVVLIQIGTKGKTIYYM